MDNCLRLFHLLPPTHLGGKIDTQDIPPPEGKNRDVSETYCPDTLVQPASVANTIWQKLVAEVCTHAYPLTLTLTLILTMTTAAPLSPRNGQRFSDIFCSP